LRKLLAVTTGDGFAVTAADAPKSTSVYLTEAEWDWLKTLYPDRVPISETRRLSVRPFKVYPNPWTCKFCKHFRPGDVICRIGHELRSPEKQACVEWAEDK
jgi:hypothetical protein